MPDLATDGSEEVGKSGQSYLRKELEPLGQEVEPDEPPTTGIGIVPSEPGFSSSEPEWLCKYVSDEDWQMPASCQRAVNESLEYEIIRSPSNPTRVAAPPVLKQRSREERERAKALAATQKPSPTDNEAEDEESSFDGSAAYSAEFSGQTQQLAPLPAERETAIRNALQELVDFLKKGDFSKDCQNNVIDKLNKIDGFSLDKFIKFLELGGDFYDGTKSNALMSTYAPDGGTGNLTVARRFKVNKGLEATTAYGSAVSKFTVFFKPTTIETDEKKSRLTGNKISGITNDNLVFIFHEGLHGFGNFLGKLKGNYDDNTLKSEDKFNLKPSNPTDTKIVSDYIKDNCFN